MTIRQHLEAILDDPSIASKHDPCYLHAVAALRALDEAPVGSYDDSEGAQDYYAVFAQYDTPKYVRMLADNLNSRPAPDPVAAATPPVIWSTKSPEDMVGDEPSPPSGT